jgi:hypothetical protein
LLKLLDPIWMHEGGCDLLNGRIGFIASGRTAQTPKVDSAVGPWNSPLGAG